MAKIKKATAIAPSNLAFIKYWGRDDSRITIPANSNISVCLDGMHTTTTVEFSNELDMDVVELDGNSLSGNKLSKVSRHLDLIRDRAGIDYSAKVVTKNSFPVATGLSSSASGFAALTVAAAQSAGLELGEKELSILARHGSGSACRSIPSGYSEWVKGGTNDTSYAKTIFPAEHWDLKFVAVVVSKEEKHVASLQGHDGAKTSPFFTTRIDRMSKKVEDCKRYLEQRDFTKLGELSEADALELHSIMITQNPALVYWSTGTLLLMRQCQQWRENGELEAYFSINTGQNIYFIVQDKDLDTLVKKLEQFDFVKDIIVNSPGEGAKAIDEHLF